MSCCFCRYETLPDGAQCGVLYESFVTSLYQLPRKRARWGQSLHSWKHVWTYHLSIPLAGCKSLAKRGFTGHSCWSQAQEIMTIESTFLRIAVKMTWFVYAVCCFWSRKRFWSFLHSTEPGRCNWGTEIINLISCGVQMCNNSSELHGQSGLSN